MCIRDRVYTSQASSDMSNTIDSFLSSRNIQFISTNQSGFNIFSNNMFVPQFPRDFKYTKINKTPSIDQERMSLMDNQYFESVTEQYFDRYSSKTISSEPSGICTISDTSTVVKYYPYGVIEYFNYSAQDMADEVLSLIHILPIIVALSVVFGYNIGIQYLIFVCGEKIWKCIKQRLLPK